MRSTAELCLITSIWGPTSGPRGPKWSHAWDRMVPRVRFATVAPTEVVPYLPRTSDHVGTCGTRGPLGLASERAPLRAQIYETKAKLHADRSSVRRAWYYITTLVMARVLRAEQAKSCGTKKRCQYSHEPKPSVNTDTEFFSRKILRVQHSKRVPSREWLYL